MKKKKGIDSVSTNVCFLIIAKISRKSSSTQGFWAFQKAKKNAQTRVSRLGRSVSEYQLWELFSGISDKLALGLFEKRASEKLDFRFKEEDSAHFECFL